MNKKLVKGLGLTGVVAAGAIAISCLSFASGTDLLGGMARWEGGESKGTVYSKLIDQRSDGYKIYGRVFVSNNWGEENYNEGYCKGVGKDKDKCLKATIKAGLPNPLVKTKSTYSKVRSEQGSY